MDNQELAKQAAEEAGTGERQRGGRDVSERICDPACWMPVPCPVCGNNLPPRGRSVGLEANLPSCCDDHRYDTANQRHLWGDYEADDYAEMMARHDARQAPAAVEVASDKDGR